MLQQQIHFHIKQQLVVAEVLNINSDLIPLFYVCSAHTTVSHDVDTGVQIIVVVGDGGLTKEEKACATRCAV